MNQAVGRQKRDVRRVGPRRARSNLEQFIESEVIPNSRIEPERPTGGEPAMFGVTVRLGVLRARMLLIDERRFGKIFEEGRCHLSRLGSLLLRVQTLGQLPFASGQLLLLRLGRQSAQLAPQPQRMRRRLGFIAFKHPQHIPQLRERDHSLTSHNLRRTFVRRTRR